VRLHDLVDPAEFRASTYYREWLVPIGVEYALGLDVREPGRFHARLRLCRDLDAGDFTSSDCRFIESLEPHLRLAVSLYSDLDEAKTGRELYADAMDSLTLATVVLDEQGRVIHSNRLAENVLRERDGLSLGQRPVGPLRSRRWATISRARPSVRQSISTPIGPLSRRRCASRDHPGDRLTSSSCAPRSRDRPARTADSTARVAVLIGSAIAEHPRPELSVDAFRQLFGLTPKEAALALRLARGRSLKQAAQDQSISLNTCSRASARDLREDRRRPPESAGRGAAKERRDAGTIARCNNDTRDADSVTLLPTTRSV
jgi:PAS domain-containing protein